MAPPGIERATFRSVAQHLNHCATISGPAAYNMCLFFNKVAGSHTFFSPRPVLYGGLGVQLASAFVSAVLPWNVMYGADGTLLAPDHVIVNQSVQAAQGPLKFLIQDLINTGHISESVANRTALATMKQIAAIRQAHLVCISLAVHIVCCIISKSKPVMYTAVGTTQLCLVYG
jgi:hypothetical protein